MLFSSFTEDDLPHIRLFGTCTVHMENAQSNVSCLALVIVVFTVMQCLVNSDWDNKLKSGALHHAKFVSNIEEGQSSGIILIFYL